MFLQTLYPAGKYLGARPYDSAYGMHLWSFIVAVAILLYIVIRLWIAVKKAKINPLFHRMKLGVSKFITF